MFDWLFKIDLCYLFQEDSLGKSFVIQPHQYVSIASFLVLAHQKVEQRLEVFAKMWILHRLNNFLDSVVLRLVGENIQIYFHTIHAYIALWLVVFRRPVPVEHF